MASFQDRAVPGRLRAFATHAGAERHITRTLRAA